MCILIGYNSRVSIKVNENLEKLMSFIRHYMCHLVRGI